MTDTFSELGRVLAELRGLADDRADARVLAVGDSAWPHAVLNAGYFRARAQRCACVGVNIDPRGLGRFAHFTIIGANGHALPFRACSFDLVLCLATLEHDCRFWETLAEIRRVLRPGGVFIVSVPAFAGREREGEATPTYKVHESLPYVRDYWRFSERAVTDIVMHGYHLDGLTTFLSPPRIMAWGRRTTG